MSLCVSACVRVVKEQRFKLSTPKQVRIVAYPPWQDLGMHRPYRGVKGSRVTAGLWSVLPAWICMSKWLLRFFVICQNSATDDKKVGLIQLIDRLSQVLQPYPIRPMNTRAFHMNPITVPYVWLVTKDFTFASCLYCRPTRIMQLSV